MYSGLLVRVLRYGGRSDSPGSVDLCRAAKDSVERSFQAELSVDSMLLEPL